MRRHESELVGEKRVDVSGYSGLEYLDAEGVAPLVLEFAGGHTLPLLEFTELLTFPELP